MPLDFSVAIVDIYGFDLNQIVDIFDGQESIKIAKRNFARRHGDANNRRDVRIFRLLRADIQTEI